MNYNQLTSPPELDETVGHSLSCDSVHEQTASAKVVMEEVKSEEMPEEQMNEMSHPQEEQAIEEQAPSSNETPTSTPKETEQTAVDNANPPETKINLALESMEKALSQTGAPRFKEFWETRKECLELFKENIPAPIRTHLWNKYCELSREARRLKEILDEQTAFAVEQIEMAVKAIEDDLNNEQEALQKAPHVHFEGAPQFLNNKIEQYVTIQRQLALLNAHASRINVLRKELIKTEMRVRHKNKFFQRLSLAGDKVFPKRKELIKENSQLFLQDVDSFIAHHFAQNEVRGDVFQIREEIKALQNMAKQLTLNTHAFTHSRKSLSECWDKLKEIDKERKKARSQQKAVHREHQVLIQAEIDETRAKIEENALSLEEARRQHDLISDKIRKTELGRDEVKQLREALANLRAPIEAKEKLLQDARLLEEQQKLAQRLEKVNLIKEKAQQYSTNVDSHTEEELSSALQQLQSESDALHLTRNEKQGLERYFRDLREKIAIKKDQAILSLAGSNADSAELQKDLKKLAEHKKQIKDNLDNLKKMSSASGLDFSKAIEVNAQIQAENERFEKVQHAIAELEKKLRSK